MDVTFENALCVVKEAVPNAFGTVLRLEKADWAGVTDGCEGRAVMAGLEKADSVGLGPTVPVSH